MDTKEIISNVCDEIKALLLEKNESYGDSALSPIGVFSELGPEAAIDVRIDDKLRRIKSGSEYKQEDTELDLIGYLILKRVLRVSEMERALAEGPIVKMTPDVEFGLSSDGREKFGRMGPLPTKNGF